MDQLNLLGRNETEKMKRQVDLPGLDPSNAGDPATKRVENIFYFLLEDPVERDREEDPRGGRF